MRIEAAIVLRLSDFSETSQIVTVFGAASGLVRLIGKGLRRHTRQKFSPGLDLLELGEMRYIPTRGDGLGTLAEWRQRETFSGLRTNLQRLYAALYAAETIPALTEEQDPHPDLFTAFETSLATLASPPPIEGARLRDPAVDPLIAAVVRFQISLLKAVGFLPTMRQCASCARARVRGRSGIFSAAAGGYLCPNCAPGAQDRRVISRALIDRGLDRGPQFEWFELLNYHVEHVAGRQMRTAGRLRAAWDGAGGGPRSESEEPE